MKIPEKYFSRRIRGGLTLTWMLAIFVVSSIPSIPNPDIDLPGFSFRFDYIFHFLVFFVLGFLTAFWRIDGSLKISVRHFVILLAVGIVFGFLDELHQMLIPGRRFNPVDFYYNAAGYISGTVLTYLIIIRHFIFRKKQFSIFKTFLQKAG